MKKLLTFFCVAALLLPVLLTGCGSGGATTVRLNEVTHSVFYAPQYVAMSLGFFADEGLNVELTNGGGADKVMTAVVSGSADIGLAGPESCIYIYNQGKDDHPVIFAQLTKRDGSFLVGRTGGSFSWEDLRGTTVIGGRKGGVPEMTLEYVMKQNGVVPQVDAVVDTSVQFNMMAGAFTGGQGDYVTLFEPTATEVERAGHGYVLCSIGEASGEIPTLPISPVRAIWPRIPTWCRALPTPLPGPSAGSRSTRTARWRRPSAISSPTPALTCWRPSRPATGRSTPGTRYPAWSSPHWSVWRR